MYLISTLSEAAYYTICKLPLTNFDTIYIMLLSAIIQVCEFLLFSVQSFPMQAPFSNILHANQKKKLPLQRPTINCSCLNCAWPLWFNPLIIIYSLCAYVINIVCNKYCSTHKIYIYMYKCSIYKITHYMQKG